MRLVTCLWLLAAGFGLFQTISAGVTVASLDLIEKIKTSEELPEIPPLLAEELVAGDVVNEQSSDEILQNRPAIDSEVVQTRAAGCSIRIRSDLTDPQPIFLQTDMAAFYPFSDNGFMELDTGKSMQMFCPGQFKVLPDTLITATCVNGNLFRVSGTTFKFPELICKSWPEIVVQKTGSKCNGGVLVKVGFKVSSSRFVDQMEVCFNEEEEVTRYVRHTLQPGNNFQQTGVSRINFVTAGFFGGKNVDKLYTQKSQLEVINKELGGNAERYFNSAKNIFLARGHLSAKADLVYGNQQRATFLFINAAPQWQVFNAGNWARVEDGIRSWVFKNKMHVECYTGVYGVTTLPNNEGREIPLYLAHDANNNGLIPVPMLYFRVVIEPATQKGIVFVGVNNPHLDLEQIEKDYIICNDVSDKVTYLSWKRTDIVAGYSYACEVSDFVKTVKTLPKLSVNGGLLI